MKRERVLRTKEDWFLGIVLIWTIYGIFFLAIRIAITVAALT